MPDRRISLVVPSYNRAPYLNVLLRSLTWSAVPPEDFEVVVVNDGGGDDLPGVVDTWRRAGLHVRLVTLRSAGTPRNNARARNAGLAVARYPIVIQTDPDIVFVSDVLAAVRAAVDDRSFCSCAGYYPLTREATEALVFRPGAPPVTAAGLRHAADGRPNQVHSPDGVGGLHGALACATQLLRDLGGYDESFEYWGWEDRELLVTAAARGLKRRFLPDTMVTHLWHPPLRGALGRDELAATRQVSRAAWDVQMQRVAAEYPRHDRPRPQPRQDAPAAVAPVPFDTAAFARWRSDGDDESFGRALDLLEDGAVDDARLKLPRPFQMCFDALNGEADVLRAAGHVQLARDLLCYALRRPWERVADACSPFEPVASCDLAARLAPGALRPRGRGPRAPGRVRRRARSARAPRPGARGPARLRGRRLSRRGAARATGPRPRRPGRGDPGRCGAPARAVAARACGPADRVPASRRANHRGPGAARDVEPGGGWGRLLRPPAAGRLPRDMSTPRRRLAEPIRWPRPTSASSCSRPPCAASAPASMSAAGLLFRHFLDYGGPAEPRVRAECATRLTAARGRVARLAGTAVASRLLGPSPALEALDQAR